MSTSAHVARRIVIVGRVQGVGFRYALADQARQRGLHGWVRNRRDESVEAVVAGDAAQVQAIIDWSRGGPPSADVSSVDVSEVAQGAYAEGDFEIKPTV
jgi:acylphosphatase